MAAGRSLRSGRTEHSVSTAPDRTVALGCRGRHRAARDARPTPFAHRRRRDRRAASCSRRWRASRCRPSAARDGASAPGLVCSEMVSACGLSHGNERTLGYLRIARDEHPLAVQIFGSEPAADGRGRADVRRRPAPTSSTSTWAARCARSRRPAPAARCSSSHELAMRASSRPSPSAVDVPVTVKLRRGVRNGSRDCLDARPASWSRPARRRSRCTRARRSRCTPAAPTTR